jgi:hypothetical protein
MKKRLSQAEEFEIMKLVLDKFLWLGFGILAFALYSILNENMLGGVIMLVVGIVVLVLFMALIVREYEIRK